MVVLQLDKRDSGDRNPYLLAIWHLGIIISSLFHHCDKKNLNIKLLISDLRRNQESYRMLFSKVKWFTRRWNGVGNTFGKQKYVWRMNEVHNHIQWHTLSCTKMQVPCRTATRGSFPLDGTFFQINEASFFFIYI